MAIENFKVGKKWEYKQVAFGGIDKGKHYQWMARDINTGEELWSMDGKFELLIWLGLDGWELVMVDEREMYIFQTRTWELNSYRELEPDAVLSQEKGKDGNRMRSSSLQVQNYVQNFVQTQILFKIHAKFCTQK